MTDNERYQELKTEIEALATAKKISGEAAREIMQLSRNYTADTLLAAWLMAQPGRLTRGLDHANGKSLNQVISAIVDL